MKKIIMIIPILWIMILNSCTQKIDVGKLLDNSETRNEIFEAIASDHDQMMSFMESLQSNEHAMQMMQGNYMMEDSMMMQNMMGNMMKNKEIMGNMMQMMNNEGLMSYECMQAMMKSMNEMGMMNQNEDKNK